ncbi:translocation protein sec62, putative, partial [Eimeria tenella]
MEIGENGRFKRPKWPKRLEICQRQNFEENYFYCCLYEGSKRWQHFMLFCVVAFVLCICMFPAWPLKLKIGVWYIAVVFLTIL